MKRSFANLFNFFHILDLTPTTTPIVVANAMPPAAKAEQSEPIAAVLKRGSGDDDYSILTSKRVMLVAHITLPDVRRLAPDIAKSRKESVIVLKHAHAK